MILAPVQLAEAEVGGGKLLPRYWTNTRAVAFSMAAAPGTTAGMRPQVEVVRLSQPYKGVPTAAGQALSPDQAGEVIVPVGSLPEGAYHWQGRLADDRGHSGPWTDYYQGPAFRLDRTPPGVPVISSPTHPNQRATYPAAMVEVTWTRPEDAGGIQGYLASIDRSPTALPSGPLIAIRKTVFGPLRNGDLYVHVRAEDWAGNLGGVATYALHIDHQAPLLAHAIFDRFQFNPRFDTLGMHVDTDKAVRVEARIRRQSTKGLVRVIDAGQVAANGEIKVAWDGRNQRGIPVQPGLYTLEIYAIDRLGNIGDAIYTGLSVNYRRIIVHLATQNMDVYDGGTLLRSTPVTTGNKALPTPPGIWHIGAKFHPYKFISPWKKGSPYYYPPSPVGYALYFHAGGYFIHDAPWRTDFGPGSNAQPGAPGSGPDAGTHGCVNVPTDVATWLYGWAATGTVVQVVQ